MMMRTPPGKYYAQVTPQPAVTQPGLSRSQSGSFRQGPVSPPQMGESCVVTYDVSGGGAMGESVQVTSSNLGPRSSSHLSAKPLTSSDKAASAQLCPTPSFELKNPYKVGDKIEIFSTSQNAWCAGTVSKIEGDWAHFSYQGTGGQQMTKIMPNGHEHIRFYGHPWTGPDTGRSQAGSSQHSSRAPASRSNSRGGGSDLVQTAPAVSMPLASSGILNPTDSLPHRPHSVGDKIEIWSTSQNAWCPGAVQKSESDWLTISYKTPGGQAMTKVMPNGHDHLRVVQVSARPLTAIPERSSSFTRTSSFTRNSLPPPPPPRPISTTTTYTIGSPVEIWSTSQNAWCKGTIGKVDGDMHHINYSGPGNQSVTKIMPSGHEHVRLLQGRS